MGKDKWFLTFVLSSRRVTKQLFYMKTKSKQTARTRQQISEKISDATTELFSCADIGGL